MSESIQEITVKPRKHPALSKVASALAVICDAGLLLSALAHVAALASICILFLLLAGVLGVIALFLRGKKSLAVFATLNGLALVPILLLIAIPNMLHLKAEANEISAVQSLRAIHEAEMQYNATYPANGYACELSQLGGSAASGPPSAQFAQLLPADLTSGHKAGYTFSILNCTKTTVNNQDHFTSYEVTAVPLTVGKTGNNGYCLDMSGTITKDTNGGANCTAPL